MWNAIKQIYDASGPLRAVYHSIAIVSMVFTVLSLVFSGFFDHRIWVNERLAASYALVEEKQISVLELILATVPSRATDDRTPQPQQLVDLRMALTQLSGRVAGVDAVSSEIVEASNAYRGQIAELSGALIRYSATNPQSHGELLLAVDRWDRAAADYSVAVESRINRFTRTILPSA
jgi:hypothetical protein